MRRLLQVDRGDARLRLDRLLVARLPEAAGLSRTRLAGWIREGRVEVDGVPVTRASQRLRPGQAVALDLPEPRVVVHAAEARPLDVLYEDAWLLAIDKPAGLVVHPTRRHPAGTLVNALLGRDAGVGAGAPGQASEAARRRIHLVHRLDRDTSGIVLIAKSPEVHARLARAMARRAVQKDYLAVVYGVPRAPRDRIDLRIRRDPVTRRMVASRYDGLPASTEIALLATTPESCGVWSTPESDANSHENHTPASRNPGNSPWTPESSAPGSTPESSSCPVSLLRCRLVTGRLHQIRVHLAGVGLPIVGDPVYGEPRWKGIADARARDACAALDRQALHAWRVRCAHPQTGAPLEIVAPLPADLRALVEAAGLAPALAAYGSANAT